MKDKWIMWVLSGFGTIGMLAFTYILSTSGLSTANSADIKNNAGKINEIKSDLKDIKTMQMKLLLNDTLDRLELREIHNHVKTQQHQLEEIHTLLIQSND